jgi:hypothetical protein
MSPAHETSTATKSFEQTLFPPSTPCLLTETTEPHFFSLPTQPKKETDRGKAGRVTKDCIFTLEA